eukprot:TRINITY_DN3694_c0_g1_i1.p2 TRINITY_DN3694_c0_g1~~TRINITY_DN3694_c0_g1_i1.p2  ORF type:complete len:238 (-),score=30.34 TRINITY_DN3694_c0_g1_i1:3-716(-)
MALIKDGKITVVLGLIINITFMIIKLIVFITTKLNLFFADSIDSLVDSFVIFLIVVFLRFNLRGHLTYLTMDMMFLSQWCVIIVFRVIIFMQQIADLVRPERREAPLLIVVVSGVVLLGGVVLMLLFVDEDDVVKCFIAPEEKARRKAAKRAKSAAPKPKSFKLLPIFAEALDNMATTAISLIVGLLLQFEIAVPYLYLIDDISNMVISVVMFVIACRGLWSLSDKYKSESSAGLLQ